MGGLLRFGAGAREELGGTEEPAAVPGAGAAPAGFTEVFFRREFKPRLSLPSTCSQERLGFQLGVRDGAGLSELRLGVSWTAWNGCGEDVGIRLPELGEGRYGWGCVTWSWGCGEDAGNKASWSWGVGVRSVPSSLLGVTALVWWTFLGLSL